MKRTDNENRVDPGKSGKKRQFKLEVGPEGPRFVLAGEAAAAAAAAAASGEPAAALDAVAGMPADWQPKPPGPESAPPADHPIGAYAASPRLAPAPRELDPGDFLATPPAIPLSVLETAAEPEREERLDLQARPLAPPSVHVLLEGVPAAPQASSVQPARAGANADAIGGTRARDGRLKRPMSRNKRKAWEVARGGEETVVAPPPKPESRPEPARAEARPVEPPPEPVAPAVRAAAPAKRPEPVRQERPAPEPVAPIRSNGGGPLVVNAPTLQSPEVLASVVSNREAAVPVDAPYRLSGVERVAAPVATPPTQEAPRASLPAAPRLPLADPTPRDMAESPESPTWAPRRERAAEWLRRPFKLGFRPEMSSLLLLTLMVGVIVLIFSKARPVPIIPGANVAVTQPSGPASGQVAHLADPHHESSRAFAHGMGRLAEYLRKGYFAVVRRTTDGTLSNDLIAEDMLTPDLGKAQWLARVKSEQLGEPLFIVAQRKGDAEPYIADKVNPSDRAARNEYMYQSWYLRQPALRQARTRYLSREALDTWRTIPAMADFIRKYPDSRMVAQALEDMRWVCYHKLQDPKKFREVMLALVDDSFHWAVQANRSTSAPELARVIGPFLKDAMNQMLYQRIHRLRSGVAEENAPTKI